TLKTRVRAVLADRGIDGVEALWDGPGRRWLEKLELPSVERESVNDLCALVDTVDPIIARLERELRARAKPDPRVEVLQHLPGVGLLTAMTLVAEIGDIGRFDTARRLCSWSGLTPRVRNSDTKVRHGHIAKMGTCGDALRARRGGPRGPGCSRPCRNAPRPAFGVTSATARRRPFWDTVLRRPAPTDRRIGSGGVR
ncbi:MAG: transposase, partial [Actinomycetota bacterium]|nr:transposase [Actinomycetota bacterium]